MIVALQATGSGIDTAIATSLIEIGIVGAPLILAVCQFINNRNDPRTDAQTVIESALLGSLSLISVSLMWGLFLVGSMWIWQETASSPTSNMLLSLTFAYFVFILSISLYQFYYMVDKRLRSTIISYILGIIMIFMVIIVYFQNVATQEDRYLYLILTSFLFIAGTILYPPVNSILSNYIPRLRKTFEDDSKNSSDQTIQCESQVEQVESDLNHAEARIEELERENERLKNEKQLILEQRNENTELVEYVEEERELQRQQQRKENAPIWRRARYWIFGFEDNK